jgi:hypothetical protein
MTREEQLVSCKKCLNRKMDLKQNLVCKLTGQEADFETTCPNFAVDETFKEFALNGNIAANKLVGKLSNEFYQRIRLDQNLPLGLIAGIGTGIIGAILWGAITVATEYQIGYMALAIGAGVGYSVGYVGKGIDQIFGIMSAVIALLSCILGNFLSTIGFIANSENLGYWETLIRFDYSYFPAVMKETFNFMDLLFYGIAIYESYRFSFRKISLQEFQTLSSKY